MIARTTALLLALTVFVCLANGQEVKKEEDSSPVKVTIAKNAPNGTIIENPEYIGVKDIPVYCYVDLVDPKPSLIRIRVFAKKVVGLRPNSAFVSLKYRLKKEDGGASFKLRPKGKWGIGVYLIKVFLDGKEVEKKEFTIVKEKPKTSQ